MSRLDELINELCPDGVEYVPLEKLGNFKYGYTAKARDSGNARFIRITDITNDGCLNPNGAKYITLSEDCQNYTLKKGDLLLARTGATYGKTLYVDSDAPAVYASFLIKITLDNSKILNRFYWHFAKSNMYWRQADKLVSGGGQPQFNANVVRRIEIPLPPLPVQSEIVRILDKFTKATTELTSLLSAEHAARKKQYEYYRDKLLTFGDGVEYRKLGEIATIERGASPRPIKHYVTDDANGVNWIKIGDVEPGAKYVTHAKEKITQEGAKKSRRVKQGDFILSNSMSFGRPYILKIDGCIHDGWLSISNFEKNCVSDYLYYVLNSTEIQREMNKKASFGGAVQNLNAEKVRSIEIPLPPLSVQARIVSILDRFDSLCNDITAGLPAEIASRKKQYEYYRDRLLSFKRKS